MSQLSAEQTAQFDRYRDLLQSLPVPLYVTDLERRILFINQAMEAFIKRPLSAYRGQPCARFGTELCGTEQCSIDRFLRGKPHTRLMHDGHAYEIGCCYLQDEAGENIGFLCLMEDASAQQDKEEMFRQLADTIPGGVCEVALDDAFTLVYGNQGYYRLYGYTQREMEQVLHNRLIDAIHPDDVPRIRKIVETAYREGKRPFEFEKRVFTKSGKMVWMLARGAFIERASGPVMSCVIIDITDRKRTEQQLKISDE